MSELSAYYENFRFAAANGNLHDDKGERCRGWHLSEVDTWHACGVCNPAGRNHPESEEEEIEARDSVGNIFGQEPQEVQVWRNGGPFPTFTADVTSDDLPF